MHNTKGISTYEAYILLRVYPIQKADTMLENIVDIHSCTSIYDTGGICSLGDILYIQGGAY